MLHEQAIDLLPEDGQDWRCPTLLDIDAADQFLKWLDQNPNFVARLKDGRWRIGVLEQHVERRTNWESLKKKLKHKKIELIVHVFQDSDRFLITEIQRAYFGSDATSDFAAQLLAYGRQTSEQGANVRVVSRHRGFRLVPNVQRYFLNVPDIGLDNEEAYLRAVMVLDFDKQVRRAAVDLVLSHNYALAIQQATITFAEEVRKEGVINNLPFKDVKNDQPMVEQALQCTEADPNKNRPAKMPYIKLNKLASLSEWGEQKGYCDIMKGVISAIRNPTVHQSAQEEFLQERFGKRHTALKFLCMLSLLFEKLEDGKVAPRADVDAT